MTVHSSESTPSQVSETNAAETGTPETSTPAPDNQHAGAAESKQQSVAPSNLDTARHSLNHALDGISLTEAERQQCQDELQELTALKSKLKRNRLAIAVFGVVGRGKSATINALLGQEVMATGAAHGTTRSGLSAQWTIRLKSKDGQAGETLNIELLDTPGLNDVAGEMRDRLAFDVAKRADLILFVVSGDITDYENQALLQLRQLQKPILLVFNKIDLYPDCDRDTIYEQLANPRIQELISTQEIVLVAAQPKPDEVLIQAIDGSEQTVWEEKPAQIAPLKRTIVQLVHREGSSLIAINVLRLVDDVRDRLIDKKLQMNEDEVSELIWKFVAAKSLAMFVNPIALLDIVAGVAIDIGMVTALAKRYGITMTRYGARTLLRKLALGWAGLIAVEISTGLLLGFGKTAAVGTAIASGGTSAGGAASAYSTAGMSQAAVAGLTSYLIGQAVREYLKASCDENPVSPKQAMRSVLSKLNKASIMRRIRQELGESLKVR
ncbi:MAG: DUF697 domain-containing protein [Cyanobacteria bacterium P01_E01_bin.45]